MPQASTIERSGTAAGLSLAALILLGTRFTQGFIFWGGATRRLIYDFHSVDGVDKAVKLDFDAPGFVAAKLTHALPGALWVQGPIEWTLRHPDLIVASVWLWTIAELAVGLGLMLGLATRAAAFASFGLNVTLMLIFGWMGSTCLDEWTMAVSGVAMSSAVFLAGGGAWSLDERYHRADAAGRSAIPWINWICSGPLPGERAAQARAGARRRVRRVHGRDLPDPVRRGRHAAALARQLPPPRYRARRTSAATPDGGVTFDAYVDAGPDTGAAYIVAAKLARCVGRARRAMGRRGARGAAGAAPSATPTRMRGRREFKTERIGFSGQTGARATITLPPPADATARAGVGLHRSCSRPSTAAAGCLL